MPDVTVEIVRGLPSDGANGAERIDGVKIIAPSERSATGRKDVFFAVEELDRRLAQPELRTRYIRNAAHSLANFESPYRDALVSEIPEADFRVWREQERTLEAAYAAAIEPKLLEALAGAA